jgi:hypothetical protein
MKLQVEVTREDIRDGILGDGYSCMVMMALERCTEGAWRAPQVCVDGAELRVMEDDGDYAVTRWRTKLPQRVQDRIWRWDDGRRIRPFSFELDVPDEAFA